MPGKRGSTVRRSSTPQYIGGSSDKRYQKETDQRLRQQAYRRWGIRLAILALLGFAVAMWGRDALDLITRTGKTAVADTEKTGKVLKGNMDERTGANFREDQ